MHNFCRLCIGSVDSLTVSSGPSPYSSPMGTKYYTRFLLQTVDESEVDEYSGVVELQAANNQSVLEPKEIEALLASSFDLDSEQVQLLNWSPLH